MPYWVAGHLSGGLGNRLFQHASAMGLAEEWSRPVVFSLPHAEPTNHGPFDNIFRLFPKTPVITDVVDFLMIPEPNGYVFTYTSFQSEPLGQNIVIDGWRQTDKYFPAVGVHAALEDAISFPRRQELLRKYKIDTTREQTCFLHIRLGDHKILPHHQLDIGTYIQRASKHFPPNTQFLVFSDEAVQYKTMLEEIVKAVGHQATVVEESDELESLYLMSQCWGGAIVGNSTFSWWGAYFARQRCPNPTSYKACYPEVWGAGLPPARDIIPAWGIRVPNA